MSETTKLTIRLPQKDVAYAKGYAKAHGLSVTQVINRYLRRMRALDDATLPPEIHAITGLVPAEVDAENQPARVPTAQAPMIRVDLNAVLDVVQTREPHYRASAGVLAEIICGAVHTAFPTHRFTTAHYIGSRYQNPIKVHDVVAIGRAVRTKARTPLRRTDTSALHAAHQAAQADTKNVLHLLALKTLRSIR